MKVIVIAVLAVASVAAFAQDKVLGPLGPNTNFERIVDGQNVYVVLKDEGKMIHNVQKGKMVTASSKTDVGKNIYITLEPYTENKCDAGDLYTRQKPMAPAKGQPPIPEQPWIKVISDPKVGATVVSRPGAEVEGQCLTIK